MTRNGATANRATAPTEVWRVALAGLALFGLLEGCAHSASSTTPTATAPGSGADADEGPRPTVRITLAEGGATLNLEVADAALPCVALPAPASPGAPEPSAATEPLSVCPDRPVNVTVERLGGATFAGGWALALAMVPQPTQARVRLDAGEGVERLGDGPQTVYFVPGPHTRALGEVGFVHLPPSESPAPGVPSPDERLAAYQRGANELTEWLGPPRRRILILDSVADDPGSGAVGRPPHANPFGALVRAWLAPEGDWWEQGVAAYLALHAAERSGGFPTEAAWDALMERYRQHRDAPGVSPSTAVGSQAANIGSLVALCLDIELREKSSSLVDELRATGAGAFTPGRLDAILAEGHPDVAARHRGRVARRGVIDLDRCLRRAGRKLVAHEVPMVDPARLLGVGDLDEDSAMVLAGGRGPLREGDVIQHIRGRRVQRAWDIVFFLRDLEGRHRFSVSVQRGERTVRAWLRMVAIGDSLPTRIRFTAEEDLEAEALADPFPPPHGPVP